MSFSSSLFRLGFYSALSLCLFLASHSTAHAAQDNTPAAQQSTAAPAAAAQSAYDFTFYAIDGTETPLSAYRGKVVLLVNTATGCGFAGHFRELQKLQETYAGQGLVVIGVPSNDFGGQEPLDGDVLAQTVADTYGATFPLMQKTAVSGPAAHPFYSWAVAQKVGGAFSGKPRWNFHKYVIGRDGRLVASVGPTTGPQASSFINTLQKALSQKIE